MSTDQQPTGARGRCRKCGQGPYLLREDGMVPEHQIVLMVSARAVRTVGAGSVRRSCTGGGKPPKGA